MKILWAENPLKTVVELDDADKRLLRERLKSECLEECLVSIHCELDPAHQETRARIGRASTLEDRIAAVIRTADLDYFCDDVPRNGKTFDQHLDERTAMFVAELADEHCGDCTCVPCSCSKCHAESLVGVDTNDGLGKHPGHYIASAFKVADSLNGAIDWLATYDPKWSPDGGGWKSREDFEVHISRWKADAQRAHEWLVAYRREHFGAAPSSGATGTSPCASDPQGGAK